MIEDMTVRGFNEHTRSGYVRHVRAFAAFIGRSPDTATAEDLRLFQLHQTQIGVQPPSINGAVSALRFLFTVTLDRPDLARRLTVVPYPRPHVHMIVPGGGISLDGTHWVRCKPGFLLPVGVLSRLFRRLFLAALADAHAAGRLAFFGEIENLRRRHAFDAYVAPLKRKKWFVYAKPPFAGPEPVLAYLARYTHRVAISNSRLIALDERGVTFRYKDYRRNGQARYRTMTLTSGEFIRRFLLHVLPKGFHRIATTDCSPAPAAKPTSRAPGS